MKLVNLYLSHNLPHQDQTNPNWDMYFSGCTMFWIIDNWKVVDSFVCIEKLCSKILQRNIFEICEKN